MMFFISDTHFHHFNIIQYCQRPFETVEEMDQTMIDNWNRVVGPDGEVWHLGDVGWFGSKRKASEFLAQLNGTIHLVIGNHDQKNVITNDRFASVQEYKRLGNVCMFHYPIWEWDHVQKGAWHLYGHVHGTPMPMTGKCMDVSVDCNNFTPLSIDQVQEHMSKLEPRPYDPNSRLKK